MNKPIIYILIIIFNTFDALFTYIAVRAGMVMEINPFMNYLIDYNPNLFLIFKLLIVPALLYLVWKNKYRLISAAITIGIIFVGYLLLVVYELTLIVFVL